MLSDLSKSRSSVLCDARDGRTPPIGKLPVVDLDDAAQRAAHPEWHDYIRRVYHGGKAGVKYDLNLFNWFYWFAPLRDKVKSLWLCEFLKDHRPEVADGTPWGGSADAWKTGPEHWGSSPGRCDCKTSSKVECYDAPKFAKNNAARRFDCTPSWINEHKVIC